MVIGRTNALRIGLFSGIRLASDRVTVPYGWGAGCKEG
jgi:hypothetical protein